MRDRGVGALLLLLLCAACCIPSGEQSRAQIADTGPPRPPEEIAAALLQRAPSEADDVDASTAQLAEIARVLLILPADAESRGALERHRRTWEIHRRTRYAVQVDHAYIESGLEVRRVRALGHDHDRLTIEALCGRVWADRTISRTGMTRRARELGFRQIVCQSPIDSIVYDL